MITTTEVTELEAGILFENDRLLCERALPDNELKSILETGRYKSDSVSNYVGMYDDNTLFSVAKWECFTSVVVNLHIYISSLLHGKGLTKDIQDIYKQWFKTRTNFVKAVILAPSSCIQVHKSVELAEFKLEGTLTKSIVWRGKLEDINIYGYQLRSDI